MAEFLAMGGDGWYVWMSYGACAVAVVAEVVALRARHHVGAGIEGQAARGGGALIRRDQHVHGVPVLPVRA